MVDFEIGASESRIIGGDRGTRQAAHRKIHRPPPIRLANGAGSICRWISPPVTPTAARSISIAC